MNPRTLRRHREKARKGLPHPALHLGRPARETTEANDARALEFCEAVLACLEKGESLF